MSEIAPAARREKSPTGIDCGSMSASAGARAAVHGLLLAVASIDIAGAGAPEAGYPTTIITPELFHQVDDDNDGVISLDALMAELSRRPDIHINDAREHFASLDVGLGPSLNAQSTHASH